MKYIVCYSGGHSSALVAIEAVRKYGKENVILLNHDISLEVEHEDIKRFKQEVAEYLGLEITYANMLGWEENTPLKISRNNHQIGIAPGKTFCTNRLKTQPFHRWLEENCSMNKEEYSILYGFDEEEYERIRFRRGALMAQGYKTEFPLAEWERTITEVEGIGIQKPITYNIFKHANCIGCLKAGKQHWYVVYVLHPSIFAEALETERLVGDSIIKNAFLKDLLPKFKEMKYRGIVPTEKVPQQTFWAKVRKELKEENTEMPCDCSF
jgi:hypothetical protein